MKMLTCPPEEKEKGTKGRTEERKKEGKKI
jgi:hypothetical protein